MKENHGEINGSTDISESQVNGVVRGLIENAHEENPFAVPMTPDEEAYLETEPGEGELEDPADIKPLGIKE
jgi:hypothetical protein